ncbi:ankyrin repeat-containing domain protein [Aspergillus crustosus]
MGQNLTIAAGIIEPEVSSPNDGRSRLHIAASEGSLPIVKLLLDVGGEISEPDSILGQTPLHIAIECEHVNVVRMFLDAGASLTVADWAFRTPVHRAIEVKNDKILRLLLDAFAKRKLSGELTDQDPLMKQLPQKHPDGSITYSTAGSALHDAAIQGSEEAIDLLLSIQPDLHTLDIYGRTALDYIPHFRPEIRNKILAHWNDHSTSDPAEQTRILRKNTTILAGNILNSEQSPIEYDFHLYTLAKCLLYLDNESAARTIFASQAETQDTEAGEARYTTVKCKRCRQHPTVAEGRWVCKTCPNVDLCAACARHYADFLISSKSCVAHEMVEIRAGDRCALGVGEGGRARVDDELLRGLIQLYT